MTLRAAIANQLWLAASRPADLAFAKALRDPRTAQESVLRRQLADVRGTRFGREHQLETVRDYRGFVERVPVRDYDALSPWIMAAARGEPGVLTRSSLRRLQPTGGSTGGCKWIPFTSAQQAEFNRAVGAWVRALARESPAAFHGRAYWSVTPAADPPAHPGFRVSAGFEDDSAYLGGLLAPLVDSALAVPGEIRRVRDMERFRHLTLLHLLRAEDLAMISVWHPSYLALLMDALRADWERLLADLARGVSAGAPGLEVPPSPRRARELARLSPGRPALLWPRLALVSCWGDAMAAGPFDHLARRFEGVRFQRKGLIATEGIVTLPYHDRHPLAITSHLYEFEEAGGRVRPAWELEDGGSYSVLLTTGGGLRRYRLGDRVRVDGFVQRTPCLRFLGKEDRVSDRCGEKLDEAFVAHALERVLARCVVHADFAMLAPETVETRSQYVLFLSAQEEPPTALGELLEQALRANPQYAWAVSLGQLAPVTVERVDPRATERYLDRMRERGARLGDIKPTALSPLDGWRDTFGSRFSRGPRGR